MEQLQLFSPRCLSVSELNRTVRVLLDMDPELQDVWVSGEISGLSRPASGHLYFTLKDATASVRCVMWRDAAVRQRAAVDGMAVEVHGRISLYEAGGQYQLYADRVQPAGEGELYAKFIQLKNRLEAEGLFAPDRKLAIPSRPKRIAVVTSPTGAAWKDVQNVIARRYPVMEVLLAPAQVQGEAAPSQLCAALRAADRSQADVLLLVRGGGSIEDLWAFNEERVVRAVAACRTPVISGVGHETDFTLVDFAADLRAPTPSAAAELVSPDMELWRREIAQLIGRSRDALQEEILHRRTALDRWSLRLAACSPSSRLRNNRQQLDEWMRRAQSALTTRMSIKRTTLQGLERLMQSINPEGILGRGYALVWKEPEGSLLRSVRKAASGDGLRIQVADGIMRARVESVASRPARDDTTREEEA